MVKFLSQLLQLWILHLQLRQGGLEKNKFHCARYDVFVLSVFCIHIFYVIYIYICIYILCTCMYTHIYIYILHTYYICIYNIYIRWIVYDCVILSSVGRSRPGRRSSWNSPVVSLCRTGSTWVVYLRTLFHRYVIHIPYILFHTYYIYIMNFNEYIYIYDYIWICMNMS